MLFTFNTLFHNVFLFNEKLKKKTFTLCLLLCALRGRCFPHKLPEMNSDGFQEKNSM